MSNLNQLFLLADHIKLSLLERQRAQRLHLDNEGDGSHDNNISRSLDQFRDGIASLHAEKERLDQSGDLVAATGLSDSLLNLQKQFDDLSSSFHGFSSSSTSRTLNHPNTSSLAADFEHATSGKPGKIVRFSDSPSDRLFDRYKDDPGVRNDSAGYQNHASQLDNQQLHLYHSQILDEQDEHLDRLGESIGRQRELSMQIGHELDNQVALLDEVDEVVDRHQSRLDRARRRLDKVAKSARENKQMTVIIVLIIVLVLLIAILK